MGTLTFPATLVGGTPENVNDLNSNLTAIATIINGAMDVANLANGAATAAKLDDAAATSRKLAPTVGVVKASGYVAIGSTVADVPGTSITIQPAVPSILIVVAGIAWSVNTVSAGTAFSVSGRINLDGADVGQRAFSEFHDGPILDGAQAGAFLCTAIDTSEHTLKLRASAGSSDGNPTTNQNSGYVYMVVAS